jgi:hypothetical protein
MHNVENYRVAYLLMVHKFPKQVRRLVERLNFPGSVFWIQVDAKSDIECFVREMSGLPNVNFVRNRCNGDWGWFPFVQANIEGIRAIDGSGYDYDHLVILSGQDYLLCSNNDLVKLLSENRTSSFVHYTRVTDQSNGHLMERVSKYHIRLPKTKKIVYPYTENQVGKQAINFVLRTSGKFPLPRTIPGERALYFGSNWLRFTKKAVSFILNIIEAEPAYTAFFKSTFLAEEHFFHTLLLNATEEERGPINNTNFTFCHWKRAPELYPVPLGMNDLDLILNSGDLLARKFDQNFDQEIFDYLDRKFA